ncbi:Kinesin light chain [Hyphodiscus hymeniophilus]|uniref:Kinesin light chain n=1 Tax=Hyphodiscus hymeniophilus TaxID=353542 RepID=A0A9P6VM00_9HELO|nr:Kinesin light chain [Hyphodiscus hymeniophilus]
MDFVHSQEHARDNPLNEEGLCILSLDGGGVRGLSSLLIIKALMSTINEERKQDGQPSVKPCQLFDLIGGTSTGGIIAIMLGRLEMDIDDCITAYGSMFQTIFQRKDWFPGCVQQILKDLGYPIDEPFNDGKERCKVAVSATDVGTSSTVLVRSYNSREELNNSTPFTICQAVQATSAASSFFEPVTVGPYKRRFVDGGLGANNPADQLWNEAQDIWCRGKGEELNKILKCFLSIGTGNPGLKPISEGFWKFLSETLVGISTETEKTAELFVKTHRVLYQEKRYFRFNVQQGLQGIALDEYQQVAIIAAATTKYMNGQETKSATQECAINLKQKRQFVLELSPKRILEWEPASKSRGVEPKSFIPFDRNRGIVRRGDTFNTLDRLFSQSSNKTVALWGLGGCGKTQIALEFAYRCQEQTKISVFWVHADSEARFRKDYTDIGKMAGLSQDLKGDDLIRAVQQWIEQQTNWLLILDNADDLRIFKALYPLPEDDQSHYCPELHQYVPNTRTGKVIWTSRDKGILDDLVDVISGFEVDRMTIEESRKLFQRKCGWDDAGTCQQDKPLLELLELLERLPLAITQAAAYIRKTKVSIRQYLAFLGESESRQSDLLSQEFRDLYRSEVPNSVILTWRTSMRRLAEASPCTQDILNTIAFFDCQEIPFELVKLAAGPEFTADGVLINAARLMDYSFLQALKQPDEDLHTYDQHRLVSLAVRQNLSEAETREFSGEALWILLQLFPDGSPGTWSTCETYLPHALKAISWGKAEYYMSRAPELLERIATFYSAKGRLGELEEIQVKLLRMREQTLGGDHHMTITAESNLALTWYNQGRFEDAEQVQVKVLEFRKKQLGKEHGATIAAMCNLASTWHAQGRFKDGEKTEKEALDLSKKVLGEDHPNTISAMSNLAQTWWRQGKIIEAEKLRQQVLILQQKKDKGLDEEGIDTIMAMAHLAASWSQQGRLAEAERVQVTVLDKLTRRLGAKHPETITVVDHLANTLSHQGRLDEAKVLQLEVFEFRKETLGEKHPKTITAMSNLATSCCYAGSMEEAEKLIREALELRKEVLGAKHPDTITTKGNLAMIMSERGRNTEAEELHREAFELKKEVLGDKHPSTISTMESLAVTEWKSGRQQEARQLQAEAVRLRKEVFGNEDTATVRAVRGLDLIDRELGKNTIKRNSVSTTSTSGVLLSVQSEPASGMPHSRRKTLKRNLMKWKGVDRKG